jgi:hypothetical protein
MGDRANFGFRDRNENIIFLYGHWAGYRMLEQLGNALVQAKPRWNDESYATRICVSQLVNAEWDRETGWGLSVNEIQDNEHKIPVVDWAKQTVTLYEEDLQTAVFSMGLQEFSDKYSSQLTMV